MMITVHFLTLDGEVLSALTLPSYTSKTRAAKLITKVAQEVKAEVLTLDGIEVTLEENHIFIPVLKAWLFVNGLKKEFLEELEHGVDAGWILNRLYERGDI